MATTHQARAVQTRHAPHGRRSGDGQLSVASGLRKLADVSDHPAGLGQLVLIVTGVIAFLTAPALDLSDQAWFALGATSLGMAGVLGASILIPVPLRGRGLLIFPASMLLALLVLGLTEPVTFAPLTGLLTFGFAFVGLTQPAGTSIKAVPPVAVVYVVVCGQLVAPVFVRLLVAMLVWTFLGELLAQMTTRRRHLTAALERAANSDALTGADNRRVWNRRLGEARPGSTIVMIDVDHFKVLNDTRGHAYGDEVLAQFGAMLLAQLRPVDCIARYGGEEFALLLTDTAVENATAVLARLHAAWAELKTGVTFSAGLAGTRADRDNAASLRAADAALYDAKSGGRNTDRVHSST